MANDPQILELHRQLSPRGRQLRDELLFRIFTELEQNNITLVELTEYYQTKYSARINHNQLQAIRTAGRRKDVARQAVNTRWQRQYEFLKGTETLAARLKRLGSDEVDVEVNTKNLTAPEPPLVPADPVVTSDLSDIIDSLGGD